MLCPRAQILDGDKYLWQALGSGLWPVMVLVSEIVQVGGHRQLGWRRTIAHDPAVACSCKR